MGLNGTVVSLPHCEQLVRVSTRGVWVGAEATGPYEDERLDLQLLQRRGSFLNCLSWKNNCSPAVKMNSELQSMHFNTLSWNSMRRCSLFSPAPGHLLAGKDLSPSGAPRRARTLDTSPSIGSWNYTLGSAHLRPRRQRLHLKTTAKKLLGPPPGNGVALYFLLTNPALYELFFGYVSVPVLL